LPPLTERTTDVPIEIEKTIRWMVSKNPDSRPSSHEELRARILNARRPSGTVKASTSQFKPLPSRDFRLDFTPPKLYSSDSLKGTERRQATNLKGNIPLFPELADSIEPEAAAVAASELLNILTQGIERAGGNTFGRGS
jgi:serine/threonine protein kinase